MEPGGWKAPFGKTETYANRMLSPGSREELSRLIDTIESGPIRESPMAARGFVGADRKEFERALFDLGLMSPAELEAFLKALPEGPRPSDGESLARSLIEARKLTRYQASAIYQGKAKI